MNVRFGMSEMMILFAAAMLWHSVIAASCIFGLAVLGGIIRFSLEWSEKQKIEEAKKQAIQQLNEQAGELGEALSGLFGSGKKKTNSTLH